MAFQVGIIKISGTIDGLSFYNSEFGWLVRIKGGPTRKQFKKSPSFARARENSSEFTNCSRTASFIRKLIIKRTGKKDSSLYHRLFKLMRRLADLDLTSARGNRQPFKGLHHLKAISLLKNFHINPTRNLFSFLVSIGIIKTIASNHKRRTNNTPKKNINSPNPFQRMLAKLSKTPCSFYLKELFRSRIPWPGAPS